jgi:hypothetical protein
MPSPEDQELLPSRRPRGVGGDEEREEVLAIFDPSRDLGCGGRFSGPLETDQHDDRRATLERELGGFATEERDQLLVDDLGHHLGRGDRAQNLLAERSHPDPIDKSGHDVDADVRFQQRKPDLAQRGFDVVFGQVPLSPQGFGDTSQAVLEPFQHKSGSLSQCPNEVKLCRAKP